MTRTWNPPVLRLSGVVFLAALLGVSGCGGKTGSITGKVYYQSKPLPSGTITFLAANNTVESSPIDREGNYRIPRIAVGLAKLSIRVTSSVPVPGYKMDPGKMKGSDPTAGTGKTPAAPPGPQVDLPWHYQDTETSKLTYEVKPGAQDHDIKLD